MFYLSKKAREILLLGKISREAMRTPVNTHMAECRAYHFNLSDSLSAGQHHPLRIPDRADEEP
jgi:hypothetical protein